MVEHESSNEMLNQVVVETLKFFRPGEVAGVEPTVRKILGKTLGRFQKYQLGDTPSYALSEKQKAQIRNFAEMTADVSRDMARLIERVDQDNLTGTLRRDAFALRYETEMKRLHEKQSPLQKEAGEKRVTQLGFIDLDYLRRINEEFGHTVADMALRSVAQKIKGCTREGIDAVGRHGGDEFVLMLADLPAEMSQQVMLRVFKEATSLVIAKTENDEKPYEIISAQELETRIQAGEKLTKAMDISLSMGVKELHKEGERPTLAGALEGPDNAAYTSKYRGRNSVTFLNVGDDKNGVNYKLVDGKFVGEECKIVKEGEYKDKEEEKEHTRKKVEEALARSLNCVYLNNNKQLTNRIKHAITELQDGIIDVCVTKH